MRLSVVIATMDRASYLDRNIASLRRSQMQPEEVVIVDSSHTSETKDVVEGWKARWSAIRYISGGRVGTSRARNLGVWATSSELILFTDDDCLTDEWCIARLVETFGSEPDADCVCGRVLPWGNVRGKVGVALKTSSQRKEWKGRSRPWGIGHSINMSFRREVFDRLHGFDEEMGPGTPLYAAEDLDLLYRVLRAGGKVVYEPTAIIYHDQWRSPSEARRRRSEYARGTAAFLSKHLLIHRDPYAALLALVRLWEDVPWLALVGLARRSLECELVSLYHLQGLLAGFWAAGSFYGRKLLAPTAEGGSETQTP